MGYKKDIFGILLMGIDFTRYKIGFKLYCLFLPIQYKYISIALEYHSLPSDGIPVMGSSSCPNFTVS